MEEENIVIKASEAASYILERMYARPQIAIILGSGLGGLADEVISDRVEIPYAEIPYFPVSTVPGHDGKMICGKIYDKNVIVMKGRFHYYEGYELDEVTFPIRVFGLMGIENLIVSNAAGGINKKFKPTDLMLITDHINISSISPLRGKNEEMFGERFPNMSEAYSLRLREIAKEASILKEEMENKIDLKDKIVEFAKDIYDTEYGSRIELKEGVYAFMRGPQYETPAEIRMLDIIGADAVGMSTVPEVIVANQMGIEVLGISCITNATGAGTIPTHEEVIDNADKVATKFKELVMRIIRRI